MPNEEPHPSQISAAIPEFFYDLISRIIPGTILLLLGLALAYPPEDPLETIKGFQGGSSFLLLVVLVLPGYVLGFLLSHLSRAWQSIGKSEDELWVGLVNDHRSYIANLHLPSPFDPFLDDGKRSERLGRFREFLHDYLKWKHPQAAFVLPKGRAETRLFQNLATGFFLLSLLAAVLWLWARCDGPPQYRYHWVFFTILFVAALLLSWGARRTERRVAERHFSFFVMVVARKGNHQEPTAPASASRVAR